MKKILASGKFYGAIRREIKTSGYDFIDATGDVKVEVPLHTHETAHFLFVLKGEYEAIVKDKKQNYHPSSAIFYPAGVTHLDHFHTNPEIRFLTVSLSSDSNKKIYNEINFIDHATDFNHCAEISLLGKRISRELQSPDCLSPVILEAMANELLVFAARNLDKSDKVPDWLKSAYELISDCCTESITIADIAAEVGIHPLHLARTFRRFFNCSPGEFLRKRRIEMASNLLINSNKPLVEIALVSGFVDQSRFTQSFKKSTGLTPAKFRQMYRKEFL